MNVSDVEGLLELGGETNRMKWMLVDAMLIKATLQTLAAKKNTNAWRETLGVSDTIVKQPRVSLSLYLTAGSGTNT